MEFTLTHDLLQWLSDIHCFNPRGDMVFFGLRGCVPLDAEDNEFRPSHRCRTASVDYRHPRCTIGQWLPQEGSLAVFLASTVPHRSSVAESESQGGSGTNQLMTGCFDDYTKGWHHAGTVYACEAFRQTAGRPVRRTCDDEDYDTDDPVTEENPYDNLHAAWCDGDQKEFSGRGCQVVVGYPKCPKRDPEPATGPWAAFHRNAYDREQQIFPYVLLTGNGASHAASADSHSVLLEWGSQGEAVEEVQRALKRERFYDGELDGDFGRRTLRSVLEFQTRRLGQDAADGIVGPITAEALGLTLPVLTQG